jgi:hypothetical protein
MISNIFIYLSQIGSLLSLVALHKVDYLLFKLSNLIKYGILVVSYLKFGVYIKGREK